MDRPYVEELRIQNYGCVQDATFRFTPLHALIGPNDSGKSTVLRALKTLGQTAAFALGRGAPAVIGGVSIPTLEGWILALLGVRRTEDLSSKRAEESLADHGVPRKDGAAMVRVVEDADLEAVPEDAESLRAWLARAREVLPPLVAKRAGA